MAEHSETGIAETGVTEVANHVETSDNGSEVTATTDPAEHDVVTTTSNTDDNRDTAETAVDDTSQVATDVDTTVVVATGENGSVEPEPATMVADVDAVAGATAVEQESTADSEVEQDAPTGVAAEATAEVPVAAAIADDDSTQEPTVDDSEEANDDENRVVKLLSVGQKVVGTVRRITDFGAFVDIGVGRDGLIHISELSVRRVGKVTDVLKESQEIEVWIKKLDRDRNRISLTLIEPGTKTIRDLQKDELVNGTVTRILPYGAFIDIGIGRDALLHIREMSEGFVAKPEDVVSVGEEIEARIIELSRRRQRVDLSIKGLRPEPEPEAPPEEEPAVAEEASEPETVDEYADMEVLSPMELAFKRAMEAEGIELGPVNNKRKRKKGKRGRSLQDEIIARTLRDR